MERLVDPLTTIDAKLWADEFMKVKARLGEQEFDHAMMLGWFANAIMQGYDEGQRRAKADAQAQIEAVQKQIEGLEQGCLRDHVDTEVANAKIMKLEGERGMWLTERVDLLSRLEVAESKLAQHQQQVEALQRELLEWKRALCGLTPGGSEFCTPNACEEWVRKHRASQHEYLIEQIKQRKDLQSQLAQRTAELEAANIRIRQLIELNANHTNGAVCHTLYMSVLGDLEASNTATSQEGQG